MCNWDYLNRAQCTVNQFVSVVTTHTYTWAIARHELTEFKAVGACVAAEQNEGPA